MSSEAPQDWQRIHLREVIGGVQAGVSVNSEGRRITEGEKGILKTSAVGGLTFNPSEHKAILKEEIRRARVSPKADHILISRMNTPALVGASTYVDQDFPNLFLPDRLWQIDVKDRRQVHVRWLSYVLASSDFRARLSAIATGTSGSMKNLSKEKFLDLVVRLPPPREQHRIAEILSSVDEAIRSTQGVMAQTQKVKRGVLKRLLSEGIGHTQFKQTEIGKIPEDWSVHLVGEVVLLASGKLKAVRGLATECDEETPFPVYGGNGLVGYDKEYLVSGSNLVIGRVGEYCGSIYQVGGKAWVTDNALYSKKYLMDLSPDYLAYALSLIPLSKIRGGGGQPLITQTSLYKQTIALPSLREQLKIAKIIKAFDDVPLRLELSRLGWVKDALLVSLLSGEKRVSPVLPLAAE
jgi:type I restriction enzyme, S subunit